MRVDILGVDFDNVTFSQAVTQACEIVAAAERAYIVTPNPEIVWMARAHETLKTALARASMVLPDGVGITLGAKILGTPLSERIPGIDFASALLKRLAAEGGRLFLLGAKPEVVEKASIRLQKDYPGIEIAGICDGYFKDDEKVIDYINETHPDVVFVCLGSPKQELWMSENINKLNTGVCIGLGGSLDIFAGTVKRAPKAFRIMGLEWFYRLITQPSRIKRMIKLPMFLLVVISRRFIGKPGVGVT